MRDVFESLAVGYIIVLSIIGFVVMGMDKRRSIRKAWRISERTLLLIALAGGGVGSYLGMYTFRHKTKHLKFKILLPLAAVLYIVISLYLIR